MIPVNRFNPCPLFESPHAHATPPSVLSHPVSPPILPYQQEPEQQRAKDAGEVGHQCDTERCAVARSVFGEPELGGEGLAEGVEGQEQCGRCCFLLDSSLC